MTTAIILNGCSSAGKSTLAQMLQQCLAEPFHYLSLDQFRDGLPSRVRGLNAPPGSEGRRGLNVVPRSETLTAIEFGDFGEAVLTAMRTTAARFTEAGIPVIIDDLLLKPSYLAEYARVMDPTNTWLIGVLAPLDVVEARERSRIGRFPGTAREHFERIHDHEVGYDATVDTSALTPRSAAERIIERLARPPEALATLRRLAG